MISLDRAVKQADIQNFISRNSGTTKKFSGHAKGQSASGSHPSEIERSWVIAKGGSGTWSNEQWGTYLAAKGYTTGSLSERLKAFMKNGTQA